MSIWGVRLAGEDRVRWIESDAELREPLLIDGVHAEIAIRPDQLHGVLPEVQQVQIEPVEKTFKSRETEAERLDELLTRYPEINAELADGCRVVTLNLKRQSFTIRDRQNQLVTIQIEET